MKKYLLVSVGILLLLTGCKKGFTCTQKLSEEDYDMEQKISFNVNKDGKVSKADLNYVMIFKDEKSAKDYFQMLDSLDQDYDIEQDKNKIIMKSTKDYLEYNETEKELKEQLKKNGYSCK